MEVDNRKIDSVNIQKLAQMTLFRCLKQKKHTRKRNNKQGRIEENKHGNENR